MRPLLASKPEQCVAYGVWVQRLVLLCMAPVVLIQGQYARIVTPKLPEPEGERRGRRGSGFPLRILIAGDSAAAGVGVDHQQWTLAGRLIATLSVTHDVEWRVVAKTGYTTADLLTRLAEEPPEPFDVAVISMGVNDLTSGARADEFLRGQRKLVELLQLRFGAAHVILSTVAPLQAMRALPQPLRWILGLRGSRFNRHLLGAAATWPGCEVQELQIRHEPEALASDGFHPGRATYERWAQALVERITSPARRRRPAKSS